jgi:nitroreductase
MNIIDYYNWRYATKKFNPEKSLADSDLELVKEAIRLAPSSYGLQLFKVLIIKDEVIKEKLKAVSYNQSQISEASHLFVFCNYTKVFEQDIDLYIKTRSKIQQQPVNELQGYGEFLKNNLLKKNSAETSIWTTNQVYIALAHLMTACATLQIDSCPIEGFDIEKYNEILDLNDRHMNAAVVAAVGYRSTSDESQNDKKVRKSSGILFEIL